MREGAEHDEGSRRRQVNTHTHTQHTHATSPKDLPQRTKLASIASVQRAQSFYGIHVVVAAHDTSFFNVRFSIAGGHTIAFHSGWFYNFQRDNDLAVVNFYFLFDFTATDA